jgi:hypothetical protein
LKVKVHQEEEFVIGGYTAPEGARQHFGALLLGGYDHGRLHYVGKVGIGFSHRTPALLARAFKPLVRKVTPFIDPARGQHVIYLAPKVVAQVAFEEWTEDRKLRQPVFLGLRDDKKPEECLLPGMAFATRSSASQSLLGTRNRSALQHRATALDPTQQFAGVELRDAFSALQCLSQPHFRQWARTRTGTAFAGAFGVDSIVLPTSANKRSSFGLQRSSTT